MSVLDRECCRVGFSSILNILGLGMKTHKQDWGNYLMLYIITYYIHIKPKQMYHLHLKCKSTFYIPSLFVENSTFCKNSFAIYHYYVFMHLYASIRQLIAPVILYHPRPAASSLSSYTAFLLGYDNQRFSQFCFLCSHGHIAKSTFLFCAFQWATFGIAGLVLPQLLSWKPTECQLLPQLNVFRRDREHLIKRYKKPPCCEGYPPH